MDGKTASNRYIVKLRIVILSVILLFNLTGCSNLVREVKVDSSVDEGISSGLVDGTDSTLENGILMSVESGYSGSSKYGRYMKVKVNITNKSVYKEGNLQVILPNSDNDNLMYQKKIVLKKEEEQSVTMEVPLTNNLSYMYVKLVGKGNKELVSKEVKLNINAYSNIVYIGLLSKDSSKLNYFSTPNTKIIYLDQDDIPENALGLDTLDVIVIDNFDTGKFKEKQSEAIKGWVKNGGTLVVGTGDYYDKTLAFNSDDFLSIKNDGFNHMSTNFGLDNIDNTIVSIEGEKEKAQVPKIVDQEITDSIVSKKVLNLVIEGAKSVMEQNGNVLMYSTEIGNGTVDILTTNLALGSKTWDTIGTSIWKQINNTFSESKIKQLQVESQGYSGEYRLYSAISNPKVKNGPQIIWYIAILAVYIVFIGPILYVILKKAEKRHLTWILVPAFAILFTIFIFLIGGSTRIEKPYVGYVSILEIDDNNVAKDQVYFSLTTPFNKSYQKQLNQLYNISAISGNIYNYGYYDTGTNNKNDNYKTSIAYTDNSTTIQMKNYDAFTPVYFKEESIYQVNGNIQSNLTYKNYFLSGTISNELDIDLKDAVILSNNNIIALGDIDSHQKVEVSKQDKKNLQSMNGIYSQDKWLEKLIDDGDKEKSFQEALKENVMNYAIGTYLFNNKVSYLVGFKQIQSNNGIIHDLNLKSNGIQLVVIPIDVKYKDNKYETVIDTSSYMTVVEGNYSSEYRMINGNELTCYYNFENNKKIISIDYPHVLNQAYDKKTWDGFTGDIYFYNVQSEKYDRIFNNQKMGKFNDLDDYLDKNNNLLVKYVVNTDLVSDNCTLPYLTMIQEVE